MASIVQTDETRARIVPRVFADVPTQAEVDSLKKSRNGLAVWLVLLIGILIAAIGGIVLLYMTQGSALLQQGSQDAQLTTERSDIIAKLSAIEAPAGVNTAAPTANTAPGTLDETVVELVRARDRRIAELTASLTERDTTIDSLERQVEDYGYFTPLQIQRQRVANLKASVTALIDDPENRWDAAVSTVPAADMRIYRDGIGASWREAAEESLTSYGDALQRISDVLERYQRPQGPSDPRPTGPAPLVNVEAGVAAPQ